MVLKWFYQTGVGMVTVIDIITYPLKRGVKSIIIP